MENASKALIIAGAILLSILLISLGIMVFNQSQDVINGSGMSQAELQSFNSKFTKYEGTQRGSVVKSLLQETIASNADEGNKDAGRLVTISMGASGTGTKLVATSGTSNTTAIKNTSTYTVKINYDSKGRVDKIYVY